MLLSRSKSHSVSFYVAGHWENDFDGLSDESASARS